MGETVDGGCAGQRVEGRLAWQVKRVGVSAKVVIEGDVLLKDNHEAIDLDCR